MNPCAMKTLAVIVNYHSGQLAQQAAASIVSSACLGAVQIVVVDNSQDFDPGRDLDDARVSVLTPAKNIGFAAACNMACERFASDLVLLLNPDARLLSGALIRMQKTLLSRPRAAAVGPLIFWDDPKRFLLPPSLPLGLFWLKALFPLPSQGLVARCLSLGWRRYALAVWQSRRPIRASNLSGGHVLIHRRCLETVGGLFDPRFFLYYEDADLFFRLTKAGYQLWIDPSAQVIHHFDQCGQGQRLDRKRELMAQSGRLFEEKHLRGWPKKIQKASRRLFAGSFPEPVSGLPPDYRGPFCLQVPQAWRKGWLFEWSPNPDLIPAAGRFGTGPVVDFPKSDWDLLSPGTYFGRLGAVGPGLGNMKPFTWIKD